MRALQNYSKTLSAGCGGGADDAFHSARRSWPRQRWVRADVTDGWGRRRGHRSPIHSTLHGTPTRGLGTAQSPFPTERAQPRALGWMEREHGRISVRAGRRWERKGTSKSIARVSKVCVSTVVLLDSCSPKRQAGRPDGVCGCAGVVGQGSQSRGTQFRPASDQRPIHLERAGKMHFVMLHILDHSEVGEVEARRDRAFDQ